MGECRPLNTGAYQLHSTAGCLLPSTVGFQRPRAVVFLPPRAVVCPRRRQTSIKEIFLLGPYSYESLNQEVISLKRTKSVNTCRVFFGQKTSFSNQSPLYRDSDYSDYSGYGSNRNNQNNRSSIR